MSRDRTQTGPNAGPDDPAPPPPSSRTTEATDHALEWRNSAPDLPSHARGQTLGRYVLLEPIGRGGMGVVYSAYDPELDRRIALKLVRRPQDERGQARLVREAQAMARLVHPNVITVHDVGHLDHEVFVAMELVQGIDLRRWLTEAHPVYEVLKVFSQAGRGLMAAHQAGLVHRDFKPANVLLGRDGAVKVVDFGLARQLDTSLDTSQLRMLECQLESSHSSLGSGDDDITRTGALLGTPAYMAPEQHARRQVDARTDQFSFCVALYEGLFGVRPFEGESRMALAVQTNRGKIRPPPRGHAVPPPITRAVLRGLSPDPADRYPTMAALLAVLSYEPGRRRRRVGVGVATVAMLGVGLLGYRYALRPTERPPVCPDAQPQLANTWDDPMHERVHATFAASALPYAKKTARYVSGRLDDWAEDWRQAHRAACEATRVSGTQPEAVLRLRQACLERQRKDLAALTRLLQEADATTIERADRVMGSLPDPQACADTEALGRVPPPVEASTRRAVDVVRDQLGEIRALNAAGRFREGLERAEQAQANAEATGYRPVVAEALWVRGTMQGRQGQHVMASQTLHEAAQVATEARHDEVLAQVWLELAWALGLGQSQHDEALRWAAYAEAIINRMGRPDRLRGELLCTRGSVRWAQGDAASALEQSQACLAIREAIMPEDPLVANTHAYVGNALTNLGRYDEAEQSYRRGMEIAAAAHGPRHPLVASMLNGLGVSLYLQHRLAEAEAEYQRAYEINLELLGPDHPDLLYSLGNIAGCRRERGEYASALLAMRRVQALVERGFPPEHREVGTTLHNIGELLALRGDHEAALDHFDRSLPIRTKVHGPEDPYVANTLTARGETLLALGRDRRARADLERALEIRTKAGDPNEHEFGRTRFGLARALWRTGGDQARALRLAQAARTDFASADSALKRQRREALQSWLRERS
ncbi:MAG: serine/threonine-protein kinase [Myxococcota bacterium]